MFVPFFPSDFAPSVNQAAYKWGLGLGVPTPPGERCGYIMSSAINGVSKMAFVSAGLRWADGKSPRNLNIGIFGQMIVVNSSQQDNI